jgi:hypothetical protein
MLGGGFSQVLETVNRIAPGETKVFRAPRREPRTIQVTSIQVPARVRPTPVPPPPGVNAVRVGSPQPNFDDAASLRCVSNVFVGDPNGYVAVDFEGAIAETNETNNRKDF